MTTYTPPGINVDQSGRARCWWCGHTPLYQDYHDHEWGMPVTDDQRLFEKICLEGFQAGLSWLTILKKRKNFRKAFLDFDFYRVVRFRSNKADRLMQDPGLVRHRQKIESALNNALRAVVLAEKFGSLASYFWRYEPEPHERPKQITHEVMLDTKTCPQAVAMAKDLKSRGWTFVGPVTVYSFMQAMGIVNDHLEGCDARANAEEARQRLVRPV